MLDADGESIYHGMKEPVELVTEGNYFNMGSLEALKVSGEEYEKRVGAIISSAYSSINEPGIG